jgi:hypothetical protein
MSTARDLLGKRVTITSPIQPGASRTGRMIALHEDPHAVIEQDDGGRICLPLDFDFAEADEPDPTAAGAITPAPGLTPDAAAATPPGRLARVEVKGFRDLGIVRVSETTLAGEPMLHVERDEGGGADFPPSSLHFITWLPDGALEGPRAALPLGQPWINPDSDPWAAIDSLADDLERARRIWVLLTQGRSGQLHRGTGWRYYQDPRGGHSSMPDYLDAYVARLVPAAARLAAVSLECLPALELIERYGQPTPGSIAAIAGAELEHVRRLVAEHVAQCSQPRTGEGSLSGACDTCRSLAVHLARCEEQAGLLAAPETGELF